MIGVLHATYDKHFFMSSIMIDFRAWCIIHILSFYKNLLGIFIYV